MQNLSDFWATLPRDFKRAERANSLTPEEKKRRLAVAILRRLVGGQPCNCGVLYEQLGIGRIDATINRGIGGRNGLRLHRSPEKEILAVRENALAVLNAMGQASFETLLAECELTLDDFSTWLAGLPSIDTLTL